VEDIVLKAGTLSLVDSKLGTEVAEQLNSPRAGDMDSAILLQMLERLTTVLDIAESRLNSYHGTQPLATSRGGPETWVTRYVDYTSKYGLGFLLNDGCSGVYFNDSTKAVLEGKGVRFEYIERRKVEIKEGGRRTEPTCEKHTLRAYPESLEKKVTLLKHFRNYLIEQQQKADDDSIPILDSFNAKVPDSLIYLKKWVRTKHAILFRLSTQTVQIVFFDQTEILLTPDERFVTYVDKHRHRSTFYLNDELVGTNLELAKRLKYSKEILQQLLLGQQRARVGI
jgi:polo-like kinase 1